MVANSDKMGICDCKMIQFMPANHSNTHCVIIILIHSDKIQSWHKRYDLNVANFGRLSQ